MSGNSLGSRIIETEFALTLLDWENLVYLAIILLVLIGARFLYPVPFWFFFTKSNLPQFSAFELNTELVINDNKAVSISLASFVFSLAIIMNGQMAFTGDNKGYQIGLVFGWVAIGIFLLMVCRFVILLLIIPNRAVIHQIKEKQSVGVAMVEAGVSIASAFIIRATTSGDPTQNSQGFGEDLATTMIFFVFGEVCIVLYAFFYRKIYGIDITTELEEKQNVAVGISLGLNIFAIGILLQTPISRSDSIIAFWVWSFLGFIALGLMRVFVDKIILFRESLTKEILEDRNWGAALIEGGTSILLTLVMTSFVGYDPNNVVNCQN